MAGNTGLGLTIRTGLVDATSAFRIPAIAESAFTKPIPIGPMTIWQRVFGTQYTAAGALSLEAWTFVRTGVNWNQIGSYGFDASVTGTIAGGFYLWLDR
jgi:hypothetical protein